MLRMSARWILNDARRWDTAIGLCSGMHNGFRNLQGGQHALAHASGGRRRVAQVCIYCSTCTRAMAGYSFHVARLKNPPLPPCGSETAADMRRSARREQETSAAHDMLALPCWLKCHNRLASHHTPLEACSCSTFHTGENLYLLKCGANLRHQRDTDTLSL